jgi:hypothetical protein
LEPCSSSTECCTSGIQVGRLEFGHSQPTKEEQPGTSPLQPRSGDAGHGPATAMPLVSRPPSDGPERRLIYSSLAVCSKPPRSPESGLDRRALFGGRNSLDFHAVCHNTLLGAAFWLSPWWEPRGVATGGKIGTLTGSYPGVFLKSERKGF